MSRPAIIYVSMIIVLIAGLWTVLAIGGHLSASEDLAGKWELHPVNAGLESKSLSIEQSGEFFQISFEQGKQMDLKLTQQSASRLLLTNGKSKLEVTGPQGADDKTLVMTGDQNGQWKAHRTVRTFPADVSATGGK